MVLNKLGSAIENATDKVASAILIDKKLIDSIIKDLQRALIEADVNVQLVKEISDEIRSTSNKKIKGIIHNSAILIHPDNKADYYHKWFLTSFGPFEEKIYFNEGEFLNVFDTKIGKIGLLVCYDIFFPELCKAYSLLGADVIVCISASPSATRKYFEIVLPARAIENTNFLITIPILSVLHNILCIL